VREPRKGAFGRAADLVEGVAAVARRMQREREPRVLLYDETGYARLLQPGARGQASVLEVGEQMVSAVDDRASAGS
jgi:hypothetical protein